MDLPEKGRGTDGYHIAHLQSYRFQQFLPDQTGGISILGVEIRHGFPLHPFDGQVPVIRQPGQIVGAPDDMGIPFDIFLHVFHAFLKLRLDRLGQGRAIPEDVIAFQ